MADPDVNPSQGFRATGAQLGWEAEEAYWRENFRSRPYATADRDFEYYRPAYHYGVDSATRHRGRTWADVEEDLRAGWARVEYRGERAWESIKDAVHDAWDRIASITK